MIEQYDWPADKVSFASDDVYGKGLEPLQERERVMKPDLPVEITLRTEVGIKNYESRVKSVSAEAIGLAAPLRKDGNIRIPVGPEIRVQFTCREPDIQGRYSFQGRVVGYRKDPIPYLLVESPAQIPFIQERGSFRFQARISVLYWWQMMRGAFTPLKKGTTLNISESGLLMIPAEQMKEYPVEGRELELSFLLNSKRIAGRGRVVRVPRLSWGWEKTEGLGIEFTDIDRRWYRMSLRQLFSNPKEVRSEPVRVYPRKWR